VRQTGKIKGNPFKAVLKTKAHEKEGEKKVKRTGDN